MALGVAIEKGVPGDKVRPRYFVEQAAGEVRESASRIHVDEGIRDIEVPGEESEPERVRVEREGEARGGEASGGAAKEGEGEVGGPQCGAEEEEVEGEGEVRGGGRGRGRANEGVEQRRGECAAVEAAEDVRREEGERRPHSSGTERRAKAGID